MGIPIFLSSDNNYAPFVATTIASICDNTKSFCNFYVLDGGITYENKLKIESLKSQFKNFSIEFIKIDAEKYFKDFITNAFLTLPTYYRFIIPKLKPGLDKVLYLDIDIIAVGDIENLLLENLDNKVLGAIKDTGDSAYIEHLKTNVDINNSHTYFNAGVLVIDCKKWREENIEEELFKIEKEYRGKLQTCDQDVLNKCFENNYKMLDIKYNEMFNEQGDVENLILRHFSGMIKPWQADFYINPQNKKPKLLKDCELFWKYAKMTPYYDDLLRMKEEFLNSHFLYKRYNKMVLEKKI